MLGVVFFFKQKTAYEMLRSLVGSEMCIRDSINKVVSGSILVVRAGKTNTAGLNKIIADYPSFKAVSYTHLTLPTIYSV